MYPASHPLAAGMPVGVPGRLKAFLNRKKKTKDTNVSLDVIDTMSIGHILHFVYIYFVDIVFICCNLLVFLLANVRQNQNFNVPLYKV